jgi:hypothetical protein
VDGLLYTYLLTLLDVLRHTKSKGIPTSRRKAALSVVLC